jgi:hypothetical protein
MSNKSNANPGFEAIKAWNGAHELKGKGDAIALRTLLAYDWSKPITAIIEGKGGSVTDTFTLRDYAIDPRQSDGVTVDSRCKSARLAAILEAVFSATGESVTNAVKQGFSRCYGAALAIQAGVVGGASVNSNNEVKLPLPLVVNFKNDKGELTPRGRKAVEAAIASAGLQGEEITEAEALRRLSNQIVVCNGKEHPFYGKLPGQTEAIALLKGAAVDNGLLTMKQRATRVTSADDKGIAFAQSITFAADMLAAINSSDESPIAFTSELRASMFRLSEQLAAYFAADPLSSSESKNA